MKKLILIAALLFSPMAVSAGPSSVDWERFEKRYGSHAPKPSYQNPRFQNRNLTDLPAEDVIRGIVRGIDCSSGRWECHIKPKRKGVKIELERRW